MSKQLLHFCCVLLVTWLLPSQTKNEKEERIGIDKFPKESIMIIQNLPNNCKMLKFYKETDNDRQSFEAKFKYKKKRYSLEFNKEGKVEDIEVRIKFRTIDNKAKLAIKQYLENNFKRHKVVKVQRQYVLDKNINPNTEIKNILEDKSAILPNYEIIAEVKTESTRDLREFLFSHSGKLLNVRIVNPSSYEHVLY
ncbi:hypothetical protein [uncultured Winogradskyella sp.]|uniref:hypothetical protein n=1 Tax=uncultured Winogradskyella sp. TaxID=395353 RepID=UPI0035183721